MVPTLTSTILIIEEEYNLRKSLQLILKHAGYTVISLEESSDAADLFENTAYSLIILSLHNNSDRNALDQVTKIRAAYPYVPIMVLAPSETTELEGTSQGTADIYLVKPFDPNLLLGHINDILKGHP